MSPQMMIAGAAALAGLLAQSGCGSTPAEAPPLPEPDGEVVRVATVQQLQTAVREARSGITILIAPGTYTLEMCLYLTGGVQDVAIRGETGRPEDVLIIGRGMANEDYGSVPHGILVGDAQDVLIADLTIRDVWYHPIQLDGPSGCARPHIYNCRLINAGQQFIKGTVDKAGNGVDGGVVEYTLMAYETTARSDYTDGVDVLGGAGWIIRHNRFVNIRAPEGQLAGPSVLMWRGCTDTICEGNWFVNCQRGIAFGLASDNPQDHRGGVIRNNIFHRGPDSPGDAGIIVWNSPGTRVLHNTVLLSGTYPNAIEYRFPATTGVQIIGNLTDAAITRRDEASAELRGNVTSAAPAWFVDAASGDLHLLPDAPVPRVQRHPECAVDFDGDPRPEGEPTPAGADVPQPGGGE
ncbi:MAG: right-handed parallel beta-helix repeat-containing protein [Armatimonadota bacterium]|nr:right-handed parallel beta-helix repeat-containing protein [Armatimonadota bacterium]